jgi:hypothetical protein
LKPDREIQPSSLPDFSVEARLPKGGPAATAPDESLDAALERMERELIQGALEQNNFSLTRAAERLKLTRHSLRYRMQRLNMKTASVVEGGENPPAAIADDESIFHAMTKQPRDADWLIFFAILLWASAWFLVSSSG